MKTTRLPLILLLLLSPVLITGCLQHIYRIQVFPDGSAHLGYEVRGDRLDFDDSGQLFPDSANWNVESRIEYHEDETEHIYEYNTGIPFYGMINDLFFWEKSSQDSVYLRRSIVVEKKTGLFGNTWILGGILFNREFTKLYGDIWDFVPEECRILDDQEKVDQLSTEVIDKLETQFALGVLQWNHQRYIKRFDRMWELIKIQIPAIPDLSPSVYSIARTAWAEDLHQYMNKLDVSNPSLIDLEWWEELKPVFLGHFVDLVGSDSLILIKKMGESLESEYKISKDIEDDNFTCKVKLPGIATKTNGTKHKQGWVEWEFAGEDLLNRDGIITLSSYEMKLNSIILILSAVIVVGFSILMMRRNRNNLN